MSKKKKCFAGHLQTWPRWSCTYRVLENRDKSYFHRFIHYWKCTQSQALHLSPSCAFWCESIKKAVSYLQRMQIRVSGLFHILAKEEYMQYSCSPNKQCGIEQCIKEFKKATESVLNKKTVYKYFSVYGIMFDQCFTYSREFPNDVPCVWDIINC